MPHSSYLDVNEVPQIEIVGVLRSRAGRRVASVEWRTF